MTLEIKKIDESLLSHFMCDSLLGARSYSIDAPKVTIKLDQNESPWDWPEEFKDRVLAQLKKASWNRYPAPFADQLVKLVAQSIAVPPECVLLGPGSNYLLALIMESLSKKMQGEFIIARPSFALYESHAKYAGIPYRVWELNQDLEYDINQLQTIKPYSVVIFASPNNPVGNVLKKSDLRTLLKNNPTSLFLADEAYYEFADEVFADLLTEFNNMIIVRTFSKAMGAAGVRLGYILAPALLIKSFQKLRLPYLINQMAILAATEVLSNPVIQAKFNDIVELAKRERGRIYEALAPLAKERNFFIKNSYANSLLVRWPTNERCQSAYQGLIQQGILVRNVSEAPGLAGCLRISLGREEENDALIAAARRCF